MSDSTHTTHHAPGFVWILAAFAAFGVLTTLLQSRFGNVISDPAAAGRLATKEEVLAAQTTMVAKMNLVQGKSSEALSKAVDTIKAMKPKTSTMLVPGSPTQLKQAAAAPAAPAKPASSPSPTPAPVTPPTK
jgi:hypothetical protein